MMTPAEGTLPLAGQSAVVTGAGRGIGREIALELGRAGADVVLAARSVQAMHEVAKLLERAGRRTLTVRTDLRDADTVDELARRAVAGLGPIDILVNNSGVEGPTRPLWEVSLAEWDETLAVNVTGAFLCCRAFLPHMIERSSGCIVNIGSITGKRPLAQRSPYAASKMALLGLTRTLAEEVGPLGIRVNLISPGLVAGERLDRVIDKQAHARGDNDVSRIRHHLESSTPLRRFTNANDVAAAVVFLTTDAAAAITGVDLNVAAGYVMY